MTRVLIVDDEPAVIQMIGCVLEIRGYEVMGAGDGKEAIQQLENCRPDLIITDLVMPRMDGLQLCQILKQDPRWSEIRWSSLLQRLETATLLMDSGKSARERMTSSPNLLILLKWLTASSGSSKIQAPITQARSPRKNKSMSNTQVKPKSRILIVDDECSIVDTLSAVLSIRGFQVLEAYSGEMAQEILANPQERPDLIVLDILLPGISGLDICKQIKSHPDTKHIPVLMITVITRDSDLADGFWKIGTGADDFVTKPFDPFDLADRIERLLALSQGRSAQIR